MKHRSTQGVVLTLAAVAVTLAGGCPQQPGFVEGLTVEPPTLEPGFYWVEPAADTAGPAKALPTLDVYAMPRYRGDVGAWFTLEGEPTWYSGPSLYELTDQGEWLRVDEREEQTLDDWLMLWDAGPETNEGG